VDSWGRKRSFVFPKNWEKIASNFVEKGAFLIKTAFFLFFTNLGKLTTGNC
jgi:hypothetical protein